MIVEECHWLVCISTGYTAAETGLSALGFIYM